MADEQDPKSSGNPLREVAKTIGSTLGSAANRAGEMLREIAPSTITGKLGIGAKPPKNTAKKANARLKAKKPAVAKSSKGGKRPAQKSAKKKSAPRAAARKKSVRKAQGKKVSRSKSR
jgi:hypothetical protein